MKRRLPDALCVLLLSVALLASRPLLWPVLRGDPDWQYHVAISRETAEHGRLTVLPQVEDLGWAQRFVDKEWLFHVLTGLGYRVAGESGVFAVGFLLSLALAAALYALCRRKADALQAVLCTAAALGCGAFLVRVDYLRPHVLAIAAVLVLARAVQEKQPVIALLAGAVFALAYHALYVPLAVAGILFVLADRRAALAAVAGLAAGTLLNPYFPANLEMGAATLRIALGDKDVRALGTELLPLPLSELLFRFGVPMLLAALGFTHKDARPLAAVAALFWVLAFWTPRAAEYATPFSVAAAAAVPWRRLAPFALLAPWLLATVVSAATVRELDTYTFGVEQTVLALPVDASAGKKVLNCSHTEGEILLNLRPKVRMVDVLDPTLLQLQNPELSELRRQFFRGQTADPLAVVRERFHADYVMCGYPQARAQLDADARFERLYPPPGSPFLRGRGPALYQVR